MKFTKQLEVSRYLLHFTCECGARDAMLREFQSMPSGSMIYRCTLCRKLYENLPQTRGESHPFPRVVVEYGEEVEWTAPRGKA